MSAEGSKWEEAGTGVRVLRLYRTELYPEWPRVVILDLTEEQFREFDRDPLQFSRRYNLYPEQPIQWTTFPAKPPLGQGVPLAARGSRWTVAIIHGRQSIATSAACPQDLMEAK